MPNAIRKILNIQHTPHNRVTSKPVHFDPIKQNKGVGPINRSKLTLFIWFCLFQVTRLTSLTRLTGGSIERSILYFISELTTNICIQPTRSKILFDNTRSEGRINVARGPQVAHHCSKRYTLLIIMSLLYFESL